MMCGFSNSDRDNYSIVLLARHLGVEKILQKTEALEMHALFFNLQLQLMKYCILMYCVIQKKRKSRISFL
jgi:hypothetical protein